MPDLLLILLKINLVLLLFAAAYYFVLRRLTFYTLNRAFLVGGILFSTIYPFLDLTDFFNQQQQIRPAVTALVPTVDIRTLIADANVMNYWRLAVILFYVGVLCMAVRLAIQFISLYRIHKSSTPGAVHQLPVRILKGEVSPFSFWQTVYLNPDLHGERELETILAHERVHVKEWHTLDIILAEISVVFYWFNPGVWLMKKAIKENIEFITDAQIVKKGIDKKAYQYSLLGIGNLESRVSLVNHFNLSDLKKRIKMMNAKRSSPRKLMLYVVMLPALLLVTLAFTIRKDVQKHLKPLTAALSHADLFYDAKTSTIPANEKTTTPVKNKGRKANPVQTVKKESSIFIVRTFIADSAMHPEVKALFKDEALPLALKGTVKGIRMSPVQFMDTLTVEGKPMEQKTIHVVIRKGEGTTLLSDDPIVVKGYKSEIKVPDSISMKNVVFLFNGKRMSADEVKKLNADQIKNIRIERTSSEVGGVINVIGTKL